MIGLEVSPGYTRPARQLPLAAFFAPGPGAHVALAQGPSQSLTVWTEIGSQCAACLRLDGMNSSTRLSWRETLVAELRCMYPVADFQLSGSWSQLQSSGSGLQSSYTGNRAVSTSSAAAIAQVTVGRDAPYDLWIHYTGRTNGGYCRVDIDGAQDLVNEIDDPAGLGYLAFGTYSPVDLKRRSSIKVASGLRGSHVVTLRAAGTASPGGNAIMIEAVAISGTLADARILPPAWQPGFAYTQGDEVQHMGIFYAARATGVSGTTGPSHIAGIASDGGLDWRADNRPTYPAFVAVDYASEREYAARFSVAGVTTELGGQTHGNEALVSRTIEIDGAPWVPVSGGNGLTLGTQVTMTENTTWQRSEGGDLGECQLQRTITSGQIRHDVSVIGTGATADIEWLYAAMAPFVHWDGETQAVVITQAEAAEQSQVVIADYAGVTPANFTYDNTHRTGLTGSALGQSFLYGLEVGKTPATDNILDRFDTILHPNQNAASASGSTDWTAKAYVTAGPNTGFQFGAGDALGFFSRHVLKVV